MQTSNRPEDARSVSDLVAHIGQGARPEFLCFWGHTPKVPGVADHSCLSNWFPAPFALDGIEYPTTEHYMMAEKARLFADPLVCEQILQADSPEAAKKLGRKVAGFDDLVWKRHRMEIVVAGNIGKFSQNSDLGAFLVSTGNKVLVEASPRDRIWGIGMGKNNEAANQPSQWRGLNLLGFALMEVRQCLRDGLDEVG